MPVRNTISVMISGADVDGMLLITASQVSRLSMTTFLLSCSSVGSRNLPLLSATIMMALFVSPLSDLLGTCWGRRGVGLSRNGVLPFPKEGLEVLGVSLDA